MYSQKVILHNLDEFALREGWMPTPHSFSEIQQFKEDINKITEIDYNSKGGEVTLRRPLTMNYARQVKKFIENEQALCALDSGYWEKNYAYLVDEKGHIKKFKNRASQEVFDSVIAEFDERQVAIQIICLKGRQVGITSKVALKFMHRLLFMPNILAIMASVQKDKSEDIERKLNVAYEQCPWWLIPTKIKKNEWSNGSKLMIESGMQPKGIGQGQTPTNVHISEISLIPDPKNVIEEGLLPATHPSKELFMVFEGTGSGNVGWFPDYWRSSKEKYPLGLARMRPIFIPWPMATDLYPESDWLREHPIPADFMLKRMNATKLHVTRCESYIRNTDYLAKVSGKDYSMPIEQQWFWQFEYGQAKDRHTLAQFAARMPADDFEALTGVHDSVFNPEVISELEGEIYEIKANSYTGELEKTRKYPMEAFAIVGHDVDEELYPSREQIDPDKDWITLRWKSNRGQDFEWELIPLLAVSEEQEIGTLDRLLVYERPMSGRSYSCGIDTADGLGKEDEDRSAICVTKNATGGSSDEQVAEFTSNRLNSAQIVAYAAAVGAWYGPACPDSRGLKYSIEQIQGPGDTCQHQLKMMGFNNHHDFRRYDSKKIKEKSSHKQGWYSTSWSVSMLMQRFIEAVNGGWFLPQSKWLLEELRTLERHDTSGKSKMEHRSGEHDDRARAAAMSYFTNHDFDILAERAQKRYALPSRKKEAKKQFRMPGTVSVGGWD